LSVLSREFIKNQIDESRRRITKSKEVLKLEKGKAEELKHLCFCPEKFTFIKKERLFSLFPNYGFTRQHVTIDSVQFRATVQHVTKRLKVKFSDFYDDPGEDDNRNLYISRQFAKIFDFAKVRLKLDDTTGRPVQNQDILFTNYTTTNGYDVSIVFSRRTTEHDSLPNLDYTDFDKEDLDIFHLWGSDPGITSIYVSNDGSDKESHQVRSYSTAEFYCRAGFKKKKPTRCAKDR
jgi:hypothetical protein